MLTNCRVVLVRSQVAGNIGAVARAMRNFGLTDLTLVAPVADPASHEAKQRSTHGESILNSARQVTTLAEAVADCLIVAGTSARTAGLLRSGMIAAPEVVIPQLLKHATSGPVALVFGPEPNGLSNDDIALCQHLIEIPTAPENPALNLSHAVAICLYELRRQSLKDVSTPTQVPAPHGERDRMYQHLRKSLESIHFLYNEKADMLMHALRQLIDRAEPTEQEVSLLHGIAGQMEWVVRNEYRAPN